MLTKTWRTRDLTEPPNCPRCESLKGQTRELHETFETASGEKVFEPPLHPHCDCFLEYANEV